MGVDLSAGNCHGQWELTHLFFSTSLVERERAKQICRGCQVAIRCKTVAFDNGEKWGIWGGLDEEDRRRGRRLNLSSVLEELLSTSSPHNTQHEQAHPAYEFPFSPSHISFQQIQTPLVLLVSPAFQPSCYAFDIAS